MKRVGGGDGGGGAERLVLFIIYVFGGLFLCYVWKYFTTATLHVTNEGKIEEQLTSG